MPLRGALGLACGLAALALAASTAHAQRGGPDPDVQLRLYINAYTSGLIKETPQDPNGAFKSHSFESNGATLELIFFSHLGLSMSRQFEQRHFTGAAGNSTKEDWVNTYYSLTGYARAAGRHRGNVFLGASTGTVDRYSATVNNVGAAPTDPARNLPLFRAFAGVEYSWERIGFRAEYVQSEAVDRIGGQKLKLTQNLQVFSAFIPFN